MGLIDFKELYLACPIANREPGAPVKRQFYQYVKDNEEIIHAIKDMDIVQGGSYIGTVFNVMKAFKTLMNKREDSADISKDFLDTLTKIKNTVTEDKVVYK
jgi:hypothetical protein